MAYRPSAGRNQMSSTAPVVPNLIPVMNLFLTIVPFLMLMLVITQVALIAFNFNQPTGEGTGGAGPGAKKNVPQVTVIIMASRIASGTYPGFEIREPGTAPDSISVANGRYNFVKLDRTLKAVRQRYPNLQDINVAPYDDVLYDNLIKTIDICRVNGFQFVHYRPPVGSS